ncbi:hypothetical protein BLA29_015433 [Euroglyphus maynei]|uniref:Uncharacterized protein n=1 Tax=Euroglyphus maynei TaxID=6958 RepID=A0A1Y3BW16_EURMA|nr:hypothetical protein BLA29_015433 [Euroglyphus maynei]
MVMRHGRLVDPGDRQDMNKTIEMRQWRMMISGGDGFASQLPTRKRPMV